MIDYLAIYAPKCLVCTHLVPEGSKTYTKCHFDSNPECPAKEVRIVATGEATRFAKALLAARKRQDLLRESEILAAVSKRGPAFEQKFLEIVKS